MPPRSRRSKSAPKFEDCPLAGTHCSECGEPQRSTPSGRACANGHGEAAYEDDRASPWAAGVHPPKDGLPGLTFTPLSADPELPPIIMVEVHDGPPVPTPSRKRPSNAKPSGARRGHLTFVTSSTRALIDTKDPEGLLAGPRLAGALVKVAPIVKASE